MPGMPLNSSITDIIIRINAKAHAKNIGCMHFSPDGGLMMRRIKGSAVTWKAENLVLKRVYEVPGHRAFAGRINRMLSGRGYFFSDFLRDARKTGTGEPYGGARRKAFPQSFPQPFPPASRSRSSLRISVRACASRARRFSSSPARMSGGTSTGRASGPSAT